MIPTPPRSVVIPFLVVFGILLTVGGLAAFGADLAIAPRPPEAAPPSRADVACVLTQAYLGAAMCGILLLVVALVLRAGRRSALARPAA